VDYVEGLVDQSIN